MIENFPATSYDTDVKSEEFECPEQHSKSELPSIENLKSRLDDIFISDSKEGNETHPLVPDENPLENKDTGRITLDDGTVITLPHTPVVKMETTNTETTVKADTTENAEVPTDDVKPTRDLTEDEKNNLKETLEWTDKQISKCTIDKDGVIHYRTDREDMEGKTGENSIRYERKTVDIHGVKVQGVFPVFESACNVQLPEDLEKASNARQFKECNEQLKEKAANDPELRDTFTAEQLEEIENWDTPSGYVWHHNEETGKMQLVKVEDHDRTQGGAAHTGGKALWGGSYSNHETSESNSNEVTDLATQSVQQEVE